MICDRFTPLDLVSRNTRSKIRRGLKKCSVIKVDKDQILENGFALWFAANLLINFVDNKNLKPGGNPEHYVKWLKALILTYPTHPLMNLFLYLGCVAKGDVRLSEELFEKTQFLLETSEYWQMRFSQFNLNGFIDHPLKHAQEIDVRLTGLKAEYGFH